MNSTKLVSEYAKFKKAAVIASYGYNDEMSAYDALVGNEEFCTTINAITKTVFYHLQGIITTDDAMRYIANA